MMKVFIFVVTWLLLSICAFAQEYKHPDIWKSGSLGGEPQEFKGGAVKLYGTYAFNKSQCPRYLRIFNKKASQVVLGKDKPYMTIEIKPQTSVWTPQLQETLFDKGLSVACTRKPDELDSKPAHVQECFASMVYK